MKAEAADYFGRFTLGAFSATERFANPVAGSDTNDYLRGSGRLYLRIFDIGEGRWDMVTDIRDKYDAFSQLNATLWQLDPKNYVHARQVYVSNFTSDSPVAFKMGRFAAYETGGTYADGMTSHYRWTKSYRTGLLAGYDPVAQDTDQLVFRSQAQVFGLYSVYEPINSQFTKSLIVDHALVQKKYDGQTDRQYFYQNLIYQWNPLSRVISSTFVDFVPRTFVQTASIEWDQGWVADSVSRLNLFSVDAIEYQRRQGVLETLSPNPYQQGSLEYEWHWNKLNTVTPSFLMGRRAYDGLTVQESKVTVHLREFTDRRWDLYYDGGQRNNFTSNDVFVGAGAGFYTDVWESSLDLDYETRKYVDDVIKHPWLMTFNLSYIRNKNLFFSLSSETANDETVRILSYFVRMTYRFGSRETAPLRDGSPPRGRL